MKFSNIHGNEDIKAVLVRMADTGKVPHAMLFEEEDGGQAMALVRSFVKYMLCTDKKNGDSCGQCVNCKQMEKGVHPDVYYSFPVTSGTKTDKKVSELTAEDYSVFFRELFVRNPYFSDKEFCETLGFDKKSPLISVAESRAIMNKISVSGVGSEYKFVIIYLPESMNASSANALLKELEEPHPGTFFLMITLSQNSVMQTIVSRCLRIRIKPNSAKEIAETLVSEFQIPEADAVKISEFAGGSIGRALNLIGEESMSSMYHNWFADLSDSMITKNYIQALDIADEIASSAGKEQQRNFCFFLSECLRKLFLLKSGMKELSGIMPAEEEFYLNLSEKAGKSFCRKSLDYINRADLMIERNVNPKIVFCNLISRMFFSF